MRIGLPTSKGYRRRFRRLRFRSHINRIQWSNIIKDVSPGPYPFLEMLNEYMVLKAKVPEEYLKGEPDTATGMMLREGE